ncbi:hypothetical protein [Paenisporosarcina antarctica]|uniref:Uncharacterized protein n=1 Tax=Paenisporosarcina antarctica TaxID=417367 RepID=A0A4P7A0S2_9BACL|nr:hypothetical protein [Paenisporosarcina antarctica]QBP42590.1 hypothetical protein E2636_16170 [Paenisporosarcina antarctica]
MNQLISHYERQQVKIDEPVVLKRLNLLFRYNMTDIELYDETRRAWRVRADREKAKYAFSVFVGIVHEVYTILTIL